MKTSTLGRAFIEKNEWVARSVRCGWDEARQLYLPYLDYNGFPTFGIGHLIQHGENFSAGRTAQQVEDLFAFDLIRFEDAVAQYVKVDLEQHEYDALVDFAYNTGAGKLNPNDNTNNPGGNTAIRMLNMGRKDLVPQYLLPYDMSAGRHDKNLRNRRIAEGYVWTHPYPEEHEEEHDTHVGYLAPMIDLWPIMRAIDDQAQNFNT